MKYVLNFQFHTRKSFPTDIPPICKRGRVVKNNEFSFTKKLILIKIRSICFENDSEAFRFQDICLPTKP